MKKKNFNYLCMNCNQKALEEFQKTGKPAYKGLVNLDVRPVFIGSKLKIYLRHYCFTCKSEEIVELDSETEVDKTVYDPEKFKRNNQKKWSDNEPS